MADQWTEAAYTRPPGMSEGKHAALRAWVARPETQARAAAFWAGLSDAQRRRVAKAAEQYYRALATGDPRRCEAAGAALLAAVEATGER